MTNPDTTDEAVSNTRQNYHGAVTGPEPSSFGVTDRAGSVVDVQSNNTPDETEVIKKNIRLLSHGAITGSAPSSFGMTEGGGYDTSEVIKVNDNEFIISVSSNGRIYTIKVDSEKVDSETGALDGKPKSPGSPEIPADVNGGGDTRPEVTAPPKDVECNSSQTSPNELPSGTVKAVVVAALALLRRQKE